MYCHHPHHDAINRSAFDLIERLQARFEKKKEVRESKGKKGKGKAAADPSAESSLFFFMR